MKWSENSLRAWAAENLEAHGFRKKESETNKRDHALFLACTPGAKRKSRFGVIEMSVLRLLLSKFRPDREERDAQRYAASVMITKAELADEIGCSDGKICSAVRKINRVARRCADGRKLILFNSRGIGINVNLFDAISARSYSEKQANSQIEAHSENIELANKTASDSIARDKLRKFQSMSIEEQARILEKAGLN